MVPSTVESLVRDSLEIDPGAQGEMLRAVHQLGRGLLLAAGLWGAIVGGALLMDRAERVRADIEQAFVTGAGPQLSIHCLLQGCR